MSVPEEVYRQARIRAAELGSSVSGLVRNYLSSLSDTEADFARLEALQHRMQEEIEDFRGGDRLSRNEVHDRAVR